MIKNYEKPQIIFEDFSLSTNIAANCDIIISNQSEGVCAYEDKRNDKFVFTTQITGCTTKEDDGDFNGICYHVPIDTKDLFNS